MKTTLSLFIQRYNNDYGYEQPFYEEWWYNLLDGNIFTIIKTLLVLWVLILLFLHRVKKEYHSNWKTYIDNFEYSPKEFYTLVKEELLAHGIKGVRTYRADLAESGIGSLRRWYMRVEWKNFQYDICGAPFGKGFFVSWWLLYKTSDLQIFLSKIPVVGLWLERNLFRITYYKVDTASMFQTCCHQSVLKVIDTITKAKGIKPITESDRKPILKNIFDR